MSGLRQRVRPLRTARRLAAGARYAAWMCSPGWWARRRRWVREETVRLGTILCAVCDRPWSETAGDLHHLSYEHLGAERHEDLIAVCRSCHEDLHRAIDASRAWQTLIASGHRDAVTRAIVDQLRRSMR